MSQQTEHFRSMDSEPTTENDRPVLGKYLTEFQRKQLQKSLQRETSALYRRRIEIMLLTDEGKTQAEICDITGCSHPTARYWMGMARGGQGHNWQDNPPGRPKKLNDEHIERLKQLVAQSPTEVAVPNQNYTYSFQRWTAQKLGQHLKAEFGVKVSERHINRLLKKMGLSTRQNPSLQKDNEKKNTSKNGIVINDIQGASLSESEKRLLLNFLENKGTMEL